MGGREVLILFVSVINAVLGAHMYGGSMSFRARGKYSNGWVVDLKYKSAYINPSFNFKWLCYSGNCGSVTQNTLKLVESRPSAPSPWYQMEGYMKRQVPIDKPFQLRSTECCRLTGDWSILTVVDLGTRSDTKKPNISPVTTFIPALRIPQNCESTIRLLAHDPDGDHVTCRYGHYKYAECGVCNHVFPVDQSRCIISFQSGKPIAYYEMEMVVEDFPKKDIHLTYYDRTVVYKNSPFRRKTREAPNKSEKYWYWDYTREVSGTDSYETIDFTDCVTDVSDDSELLTTFIVTTEDTTETLTRIADDCYTTKETTTEETINLPSESTNVPNLETSHFYTQEAVTDHLTDISVDTTTHFYITGAITETTQQIVTEAVTSPYETTGSELYPTSHPPDYTNPLSKIPLQFVIEVTNPAPSCAFGDYRPRFLHPTPNHGTKFKIIVGKKFQLQLAAHVVYERITDFKISGPPGMTKSLTSKYRSNIWSMIMEWTPTEADRGEPIPVCFVAETHNGYQSEMRCIMLLEESPPKLVDTTLLCHDNTMALIIAKSADVEFHLKDPKCLVTSNSTHYIASVGYNSCGTVTEETEDDIVFKNMVTSNDISVLITRQNGITIPFNCSFPKKNRISSSFRAHKSDYIFTEGSFGNFTYKFQFYTDSQFVELNTQSPLEVEIKELLYMEIQVSSSVPNIELFVESCKAMPHDIPSDPVFYDIIQNGCIKDNTVMVYPSSNTNYRFAMEAFAFIGNYPEVYISCIVIICKTGAPNTRCTKGCITKSMEASSKHRDRRSLVSESQQHFISQGPVSMKRGTSANQAGVVKMSALNGTTLVIALSVMATVAVISLLINIYMKRSSSAEYQRLNMQDY